VQYGVSVGQVGGVVKGTRTTTTKGQRNAKCYVTLSGWVWMAGC